MGVFVLDFAFGLGDFALGLWKTVVSRVDFFWISLGRGETVRGLLLTWVEESPVTAPKARWAMPVAWLT